MAINTKQKRWLDYYVGRLCLGALYLFVRIFSLLFRRNHELPPRRHLAFIKILGGGNLFTLYPVVLAIQRTHPEMKVSLICGRSLHSFAKMMACFDEIHCIEDQNLLRMLLSFPQTIAWLLKNIDTVIDTELHSRATTVLSTLGASRNRIGLVDQESIWKRKFYTHSIYQNPARSRYIPFDAVAALMGAPSLEIAQARKIFASTLEKISIDDQLDVPTSYFVFGVGCSDLSKERKLASAEGTWIAQELLKKQSTSSLLFLGDQSDEILVNEIIEAVGMRNRCLNFCGHTNLDQSVAILARARGYAGIDSALLHISRFLKVPTLGIWGPTDPSSLLRPLDTPEKHLYLGIGCSPCVHFSFEPPCLGKNECMRFSPTVLSTGVDFLLASHSAILREPVVEKAWVYFPERAEPQWVPVQIAFD